MEIQQVIKEVKGKSRKRNFVQTIDLTINLQNIDLKKPESRFTEELVLPKGRGKDIKVAVIGKNLVISAKGDADTVIDEKSLDKIEKSKAEIRRLVNNYDFFIAEAPFMLRIGKSLGKVLGPRGKMPKPLPPQADPKPMIARLKKTIRISVKETHVVHCAVGTENMEDKDLEENINSALNALKNKLPKGENNIKSVYLKTTMGAAVKLK